MGRRAIERYIMIGVICLLAISLIYQLSSPTCFSSHSHQTLWISPKRFVVSNDEKSGEISKFAYNRYMPFIFIGGMPRSGTTLLRTLLDAHPDIKCGAETRLIPRLLGAVPSWLKEPFESQLLAEAGITDEVIASAVGAFILEIIARRGAPAPRLCTKDPFSLRSAVYLRHLFPNSKFILMIRDGRAVVHSLITRNVTIKNFDTKDFRKSIIKWNQAMSKMHSQCQQLGSSVCLPVNYEKLVLQPKVYLQKILNFLSVPWNESVLHHETLVGKKEGVPLSKFGPSADQVIKPINIEALSKWVGHIPDDVIRDMANIAPMLSTFGYDPNANPPNYGRPDDFVAKNMEHLDQNKDEWIAKQKDLFISIQESIQNSLNKQNNNKNNQINSFDNNVDFIHQSSDNNHKPVAGQQTIT